MAKTVDVSLLNIGSRCRMHSGEELEVRDIRQADNGQTVLYWKPVNLFWFYSKDGKVAELTPHKHDIVEVL